MKTLKFISLFRKFLQDFFSQFYSKLKRKILGNKIEYVYISAYEEKNERFGLIDRRGSKKTSESYISGLKLSRDDWLYEMRSKWNVH
jgi:hypothetical protein